jgi:hypothetical protein
MIETRRETIREVETLDVYPRTSISPTDVTIHFRPSSIVSL